MKSNLTHQRSASKINLRYMKLTASRDIEAIRRMTDRD
jgi:hypothetical protein